MTTKRTFGLVGDYGDSDSEEEEEDEEVKKAKVNLKPSNSVYNLYNSIMKQIIERPRTYKGSWTL